MERLKKIILLVIALIIICLVYPRDVYAEDWYKESGDYRYVVLEDNTAAIVKYIGTDKYVTIPSKINGYVVTKIGCDAFSDHYHIESVCMPDSIKVIEDDAFFNCEELEKITLSNSLIEIGSHAFGRCLSLKKLNYPRVLQLWDQAFFLLPLLVV